MLSSSGEGKKKKIITMVMSITLWSDHIPDGKTFRTLRFRENVNFLNYAVIAALVSCSMFEA